MRHVDLFPVELFSEALSTNWFPDLISKFGKEILRIFCTLFSYVSFFVTYINLSSTNSTVRCRVCSALQQLTYQCATHQPFLFSYFLV
ncbi:MAG: hypothetical protein ACK53Y_28110, partial [bacterium]